MAEPIHFQPTPVPTAPNARDALNELLEVAHEKGLLRLATTTLKAEAPIARILAQGLNGAGARRAVQNLTSLLAELGRIEPAVFYKTLTALSAAARQLDTGEAQHGEVRAPGVTGLYRILHEDALWHDMAPLFDALKAFTGRLQKPVDTPIADASGKPVEN